MKDNYNRIFKLIVFDVDDKIISVCEFVFFSAFCETIDNLVCDGEYEYKDEFINYDEGCLYISLKKSVDY